MSAQDPSLHHGRRRPEPIRELPFVTVLALAGFVLVLGLRGGSSPDTIAAGGDDGPSDTPSVIALASPDDAREDAPIVGEHVLAPVRPTSDRDSLAMGGGDRRGTGTRLFGPLQPTPGFDAPLVRTSGDPARDRGATDDLSGLREEGSYHLGVRHGDWVVLHDGGSVRERGKYSNGLRDGLWETFSTAGSLLKEADYREGLKHGDWRMYASTGDVIGEGAYEENLMSGRWTLWYSNGSVKERGRYENGLREGVWEFFDDLGRPTPRSGTYRAGIQID